MDQYIIYIFLMVVLIMASSLGFTILSLIYSWLKLKMVELEIWKDKII